MDAIPMDASDPEPTSKISAQEGDNEQFDPRFLGWRDHNLPVCPSLLTLRFSLKSGDSVLSYLITCTNMQTNSDRHFSCFRTWPRSTRCQVRYLNR